MVRPLFFEYREDPTSWLTEDQYMFGTDLLVAPLMEEGRDRGAYLSPGRWAD
jgi:alpha-D-xyloside xylohydrolase